jgi:hypothetical protein
MSLWRLFRGDLGDVPGLMRNLRWWRVSGRHRWRPAWVAGSALLAVETRRSMGRIAAPAAGPYRDAAADLTGPRRLASLVYVGEPVTDSPVIRRIEIDPEHGRPHLLWEASMPKGARLEAGGFGRLGGLLLAPGPDGLHARDLYTMRACWHFSASAPAVDLLSLSDGDLWVRMSDGSVAMIDPTSGEERQARPERRSAAGEIARGALPVHDPLALPPETLLFGGASLEVTRGAIEVRELSGWRSSTRAEVAPPAGRRELPGWTVQGPVLPVKDALLAWVVDDADRYGVATLESSSLELRGVAEIGRLVGARVTGMYALDGLGIVRVALGRGDATARRTWVVDPERGRLLASIGSDGELVAEGWRSRL